MASFLEMLLPLRGTRRFVQVIIGLFILLAVLGPIAALLRQQPPLNFDLPADTQGADLQTILEQGQSVQNVVSGQEQTAYIQGMEDQIEVMCKLVPGVQDARATVSLSPDASLKSLGTVQSVVVAIQSGEQQMANPVTTMQSGSDSGAAANTLVSRQEIVDQIKSTVANLFGLQKEQISVNFQESGAETQESGDSGQ